MGRKQKQVATWTALLKSQVSSVSETVFATMAGGAAGLSREFFELLKAIGEAKSKQEEERLVSEEVLRLRAALARPDSKERMKELLLRMIYCEMLGRDTEFGYIHALNMTQSSNLLEKRVGYLSVATFLDADHPLMILLVNSFRRDLESSNYLEVSAALTTIVELLTRDTVPMVLSLITGLLDHPKELLRKKAVLVLHQCWQLDRKSTDGLMGKMRKTLCDRNPSVLGAAVVMFHGIIKEEGPAKHLDLVPSFVSILKQVVEHRLPKGYDYHRIPAPWLQIRLLQILQLLAGGNAEASKHVYNVLLEASSRADTGTNAGFSVVYECIRTATCLAPNREVLDKVALHIDTFLEGPNNTLKCLGVDSLRRLAEIDRKYAVPHQVAVVDCLEDADETLQGKTLELLNVMTNKRNVVTVTEKMIRALRRARSPALRSQLVLRITQNAQRFSPNFPWFMETITSMMLIGQDEVPASVAHGVMQLLRDGPTVPHDIKSMRSYAVDAFARILSDAKVTDLLTCLCCWTLGEYGLEAGSLGSEEIVTLLCDTLEHHRHGSDTAAWAIVGLVQVIGKDPSLLDVALEIISDFESSRSTAVQQQSYEARQLLADSSPPPALLSPLGEAIDYSLGFLDSYVNDALECGAAPYDRRVIVEEDEGSSTLHYEEYPAPEPEYSVERFTPAAGEQESPSQRLESSSAPKVWSRDGLSPSSKASSRSKSYSRVKKGWGGVSKYSNRHTYEDSIAANAKEGGSKSEHVKEATKKQRRKKKAEVLFGAVDGDCDDSLAFVPAPSALAAVPTTPSMMERTSEGESSAAIPPTSGRWGRKVKTPPAVAVGDSAEETESPVPLVTGGSHAADDEEGRPSSPHEEAVTPLLVATSVEPAPLLVDLGGAKTVQASSTQASDPLIAKPVQLTDGVTSLTGSYDVAAAASSSSVPYSAKMERLMASTRLQPRGDRQELYSDNRLSMHYTMCWSANTTMLLEWTNLSSEPLSSVESVVSVPGNLAVRSSSVDGVVIAAASSSISFSAPGLPASSKVCAMVELVLAKHSFTMSVTSKSSYETQRKLLKQFQTTHRLDVCDFMRPSAMATTAFGKQWQGLSTFQQQALRVGPTHFSSASELNGQAAKNLNLHAIQVIGEEAISTGVLSLSGTDTRVLVHCKLDGMHVLVTVRSSEPMVTQLVARNLQRWLQSSLC